MRAALVVLAIAAAGCGSSRVGGYGVSFAPPPGWHVHLARGAWTASGPGGRVQLFEDTPDAQWSPPLDFNVYGRFPRRNFTLAGRYFDLFVKGDVSALVRTIRVQPGDFYPGGAAPARFRPAPGWRTETVGALPNGTSMFSVTIASTGRYVDQLDEDAPWRTLPRLGRNGIVVIARLDADNRAPPPARSTSFHFTRLGPCVVGDGPPLPHAACTGASRAVAREYTAGVAVFYGRAHPTATQRARAGAELTRLVLPRWVRWD